MTVTEPTRTYALRRLNPFLGVVAVLETGSARALSYDGESWQLQVLAERPEHTWGSLNRGRAVQQYFRFGLWSRSDGMTRVPINPLLDVGAMLAAAHALVAALEQAERRLPFLLTDRYEYWLLDAADQPLALLAAASDERYLEAAAVTDWHATLPAGAPFVSPALEARGIPVQTMRSRRRHAELLEEQIRASGTRCQWLSRQRDGSGVGLAPNGPPELVGRQLPAVAFPSAGLRTDWSEAAQADLAWDYLEWAAPRLLALQDLSQALRQRLEAAARGQALLVASSFRMYPRVLNPAWIDAARVEARLRQAAETA
jgi:hypothetical protein